MLEGKTCSLRRAFTICLQDLGEQEWPDTGPLSPTLLKPLAHRLVLLRFLTLFANS